MALIKVKERGRETVNLGRRNLIINGAMQVAQRGTSSFDSQGTGSGEGYTVDRFAWVRREETGSGFTFNATITQDADSPSGFDKSLKVVSDAAQATLSGSENALITTKFEGQDLQRFGWGTTGAKDLTLSFWVKSNKAGTYCVQSRYINNATSGLFEYNVSSSGVWEYKTISIPANQSFSFTSNNAKEMELMFHLAVGPSDILSASPSIGTTNFKATSNQVNLMDTASNYWQITGVQLEMGSTATDFEHRSYAEELQLCQRYFWRQYHSGSNVVYDRVYWNGAAQNSLFDFPAPAGMRINAATVTCTPTTNGTSVTFTYHTHGVISIYRATANGDNYFYSPELSISAEL